MEKTNTHHHDIHHNTHQLGLNMSPIQPITPKLNEYQKQFLTIFYYNNDTAITQTQLSNTVSCHENTINRFIKKALNIGWIKKLKSKEGMTINNAYYYFKSPDTLETGQEIHDKRYSYYSITKKGTDFYNSNFL